MPRESPIRSTALIESGEGPEVPCAPRLRLRLGRRGHLREQELRDALLAFGEVLDRQVDVARRHRAAGRAVVREHVECLTSITFTQQRQLHLPINLA